MSEKYSQSGLVNNCQFLDGVRNVQMRLTECQTTDSLLSFTPL